MSLADILDLIDEKWFVCGRKRSVVLKTGAGIVVKVQCKALVWDGLDVEV